MVQDSTIRVALLAALLVSIGGCGKVGPGDTTDAGSDAGSDAWDVPARDVLVVEDLPAPGLYALERDGRELCQFGVSFEDPEESDLRSREAGSRAPSAALASTLAAFGPLETGLLFAGILALLFDWWVLMRMRRATETTEGV